MKSTLIVFFVYNTSILSAIDCSRAGVLEKVSFITKRQLEECLPIYGRTPVEKTFAVNIWRAVKKIFHNVDGIPLSIYQNMGWTLCGVPLEDLENMTINQAELIKIFGSAESLKDDQMQIIAKKVKSDWANKTPEKYSEFDLRILGKVLCYFNQSEILKIHPDAYRAAAKSIGKLNTCPTEIIQSFAKLAIQSNAFGSPSKWSKLDISEIGVIIAGLSDAEYNSIETENLMQNKRIYNQVYGNRHPNRNSSTGVLNANMNSSTNIKLSDS